LGSQIQTRGDERSNDHAGGADRMQEFKRVVDLPTSMEAFEAFTAKIFTLGLANTDKG